MSSQKQSEINILEVYAHFVQEHAHTSWHDDCMDSEINWLFGQKPDYRIVFNEQMSI